MSASYPAPITPHCSNCQEPMEPGFVVDHTYGSSLQSSWVEGKPVDSFWTGLKLKGRLVFPVTTFRCRSCGLLHSYAFRPSERHG